MPENFISLSVLETINIDLVRRTTEDMNGNLTLHFDATDRRVLTRDETYMFKAEIDRRWRKKVSTVA
jgi:hypothetical protein